MTVSSRGNPLIPGPVDRVGRDVLVGRDRERRLLGAFVQSVSGGGGAGVLVGEPGIGKTALLRWVAQVSPSRVVWVRGIQTEAALPYAAATDLLMPFSEYFDTVAPARRHALEVALGLAEGAVCPALAACAGALGVLAAAADHQPVVILVDDVQWVDAESRQLRLSDMKPDR